MLKECPPPEVSVLLPVYNTKEEYLRACIESILNQTFTNFELVILNDGSTNNAQEIILSYNDPRIKYYKQDNSGITKTRNKLLSLAQGKYIAIADHDDISLADRLEKEYNYLENNPQISLVSGWIEILNTKKIWKTKPSPRYLDFLKRCEIIHPACMWRKADFEKYNLIYEEGYYGAQDYALFAKAAKYLNMANIQEVLLKYRKHENNASNQKSKMSSESEKIQKEILNFLTENIKTQKLLYNKFAQQDVTFLQNIFSIRNDRSKKIVRIFGLQFKLKRNFKN